MFDRLIIATQSTVYCLSVYQKQAKSEKKKKREKERGGRNGHHTLLSTKKKFPQSIRPFSND